jgi:hypothetical protein
MANNCVKITSTAGISAAGGLSAGKTSYFADKVGIGTNYPGTFLEIDGGTGVASTGGTLVIRQKGNTFNDGISITSSHANSHRIWKDSSSTLHIGSTVDPDAFAQTLAGNIGIGTTSPGSKLTVQGILSTSDTACVGGFLYATCGRFSNDVCIGGNELFFANDAASSYIKGADDLYIQADYDADDTNKGLLFETGGQRRLNINQNGLSASGDLCAYQGYFTNNVGIGTSTPNAELTVVGDTTIT